MLRCRSPADAGLVGNSDLTQDETWQSLRVGVSAVATIWNRWGINGDVAYLPYAQFSGLDSHTTRVPVAFYPEDGTGRGVQAELILILPVHRKSRVWRWRTVLGLLEHERQPDLSWRL